MAEVGDLVQVPSKRVGQAPRQGVVVAASGSLLRIEWSSGEVTSVMPSMGSLQVVGRARTKGRKAASKSAVAAPTTRTASKAVPGARVSKQAKSASGAKSAKATKSTKSAKSAKAGSRSAKRSGGPKRRK